jgi:hypothetical protein
VSMHGRHEGMHAAPVQRQCNSIAQWTQGHGKGSGSRQGQWEPTKRGPGQVWNSLASLGVYMRDPLTPGNGPDACAAACTARRGCRERSAPHVVSPLFIAASAGVGDRALPAANRRAVHPSALVLTLLSAITRCRGNHLLQLDCFLPESMDDTRASPHQQPLLRTNGVEQQVIECAVTQKRP